MTDRVYTVNLQLPSAAGSLHRTGTVVSADARLAIQKVSEHMTERGYVGPFTCLSVSSVDLPPPLTEQLATMVRLHGLYHVVEMLYKLCEENSGQAADNPTPARMWSRRGNILLEALIEIDKNVIKDKETTKCPF